jgi:hypothetical protein
MKHFRSRYSLIGGILLALLAVIVGSTVLYGKFDAGFAITIIATFLSYFYFAQKQDLEELSLFKKLFTEFNGRYDGLNEGLNLILRGDANTELTTEEIDLLYNYFNLCGEEYLFFKRGFIYREVWKAWLNGMKIFYQNERVRRIWEEELKTDSYYGLKIE